MTQNTTPETQETRSAEKILADKYASLCAVLGERTLMIRRLSQEMQAIEAEINKVQAEAKEAPSDKQAASS